MKQLLPLTLCAAAILSGCGVKTVYVDRVIKEKVPVPCSVPSPDCPHLGDLNDSEAVYELGRCIEQYEENIGACK